MIIRVRHLGLAAFIRMKGFDLMKVESKEFTFESDKSIQEWRVEYNNSCCMLHDAVVCELRHHLKSSP